MNDFDDKQLTAMLAEIDQQTTEVDKLLTEYLDCHGKCKTGDSTKDMIHHTSELSELSDELRTVLAAAAMMRLAKQGDN